MPTPCKPRRRAWARVLLAGLCVGVIAATWAATGASGAGAVPPKLLEDLAALNKKLDTVITETQNGQDEQAVKDARGADKAKNTFVARWFGDDSKYGVHYGLISFNLECVDISLDNIGSAVKHDAGEKQINALISSAERCVKDLRDRIKADAPQAVLDDLKKVSDGLDDLKKKSPNIKPADRTKVEDAKLNLVDKHFKTKIYGVPFPGGFRDVDCIDRNLLIGIHALTDDLDSDAALAAFGKAKECKDALEKKYKKAAGL